MKIPLFTSLFWLILVTTSVRAEAVYPGDIAVDPSFNVNPLAANGSVYAVVRLPDGKWLVGGSFVQWNEIPMLHLARLNADLSLDLDYTPPDIGGSVSTLALNADGTVLMGGSFKAVDGHLRAGLARLKADLSLDLGWQARGEFIRVTLLAVQADGRFLVVREGSETALASTDVLRRLNADGSLDPTFEVDILQGSLPGQIFTVVAEPGGKIAFGGMFDQVNGVTQTNLARVDSLGVFDTVFGGTGATGGSVYTMTLLDDGRYLIGGSFSSVNGVSRRRVATLLASNGGLDPSFVPASSPVAVTVTSAVKLSDGSILTGGINVLPGSVYKVSCVRFSASGGLVFSSPGAFLQFLLGFEFS